MYLKMRVESSKQVTVIFFLFLKRSSEKITRSKWLWQEHGELGGQEKTSLQLIIGFKNKHPLGNSTTLEWFKNTNWKTLKTVKRLLKRSHKALHVNWGGGGELIASEKASVSGLRTPSKKPGSEVLRGGWRPPKRGFLSPSQKLQFAHFFGNSHKSFKRHSYCWGNVL